MAHHGGNTAKGGFYWKKGAWEIVTVKGKTGTLPGTEDVEYLRIPTVLLGPLVLILGFGFYIVLPFVGLVIVFSAIGEKIWGGLAHASPVRGEKSAS